MEFSGTVSRRFLGGIFGETVGGLNVDIFGKFRRVHDRVVILGNF